MENDNSKLKMEEKNLQNNQTKRLLNIIRSLLFLPKTGSIFESLLILILIFNLFLFLEAFTSSSITGNPPLSSDAIFTFSVFTFVTMFLAIINIFLGLKAKNKKRIITSIFLTLILLGGLLFVLNMESILSGK